MISCSIIRSILCKPSKLCSTRTLLLTKQTKMSEARSHAHGIFLSAIDSVLPPTMVTRTLKCSGDNLLVNGTTYLLDHNLHIVAFGKAVAGMVRATKDMRVASVPVGIAQSLHGNGHSDLLPHETSIMKLLEGAANNLPDKPTQRVTSLIVDFAASLTKDDILITLISDN